MNILVISHAHPDFSIGGAEIAAYNLFQALRTSLPENRVTFLARVEDAGQAPGSIVWRRPDEYLWQQEMGNWFYLQSGNPTSLFLSFKDFLLRCQPDAVFVQHFAHIGVEVFRAIRLALPRSIIIATLHEYMAICHRNGQMLKRLPNRLCYTESISDCHRCFPEFSEEDFWLRKNYVQKHLGYVDHFISPSAFLRQRYIDWGVDPDAFSVIENGQPKRPTLDFRQAHVTSRIRFGYFGQITEYKGVDILLRAIHEMPSNIRDRASFEIHGANLDQQGQWLKDLIEELRAPLIEDGVVRWAGPYTREDALRKISRVDWVIVPSIWWENSPMVIQEAFVCGKPVICSNIGGMAEKVKDGVNGVHFHVSDPVSLSDKLLEIIDGMTLSADKQTVDLPATYAEIASLHVTLVSSLSRAR